MLEVYQRGGSPTAADIILASRMGYHAVELLENDIGNRVVAIRRNQIVDYDIKEALDMPKEFNQDLYNLALVLSI